MSVPVIDALAQAIYAYEGNKPGDRAYRNSNPGNLRASSPNVAQDEDHYRVFPSFIAGYTALLVDIEAKITGQNPHGLNLDSTLIQLFQVYAPAADHNVPEAYAEFVAGWLSRTYGELVVPAHTFREIYVNAAKEAVPVGVTTA